MSDYQKNKYESKLVDKKFKAKHTCLGSGTLGYNLWTNNYKEHRGPRHPYKGRGNSIKPGTNGCSCCSRGPKAKVITRLHNKKEIAKMLVSKD